MHLVHRIHKESPMQATINHLRLLIEVQLNLLGVRTRDDRGAVST